MNRQDKFLLGLDIGGSSIKFGYGSCPKSLQYFSKVKLQHKSLSYMQQACSQILSIVDSQVGLSAIQAIGIGTCGTIDSRSGLIVGVNPNLKFWVNLPPSAILPPGMNLPVAWDNDANLMCLAEATLSCPQGRVLGITVGSGIGCGYVQGGKVYHGAHGFAMELGHVTAVHQGVPCNCGRHGCVEAYASMEGIKRRIVSELGLEEVQDLPLILRHRHDDPRLEHLIQEGEKYLSLSVANLIVTLDPDLVVFGGGLMDAGLYSIADLRRRISELLPELNSGQVRIERAKEGNKAGVLGAIILAGQMIKSESE